ncbi:hypothetical protein GTY67_09390 [Streptomyces sp. SID8374]|uniref:hypothetical protein n=1 Tax=Streptomyces sp. SID8374 TaxID=2690354 RepID=UPI00136BFF69|nr:hypothetical protein [Streptomyces sp. SID8374]MYX13638.1 hypothetical protein [Streptomyces sp. SID8374]
MSRPVQGGLTVTALVFVPLLAVAGSDGFRATLDFTTGVLSLVSLSAAVAWGLLATDRLFLSTRQRIVCQGIHRATAIAALGFLLLHGTVKIALGHVSLIGALIPFGLGVTGTAGLIGFGSLAGLLMVVTAATGAMRSAFAQPSATATRLGQSLGSPREAGGIAGRWRALHALAYPAWCAALIHGLYAGRAPATWVVVMYSLCLTAVAGALCLRLLPGPTKRRITDRISALMSPEADFDAPDPVLRGSSRPGTERGPGREPPSGDPAGWSEPDREVRGTPVRPRTLSAPLPPPVPPPVPLSGSLHSLDETRPLPDPLSTHGTHSPHEAPTELLYGVQPPAYEPPPRSSDRLADGPTSGPGIGPTGGPGIGVTGGPGIGVTGGPGISAGYRAVSQAGNSARPPGARWPAPSPAPPAQAHHRPQGAEHTYAPPQEPPLYASPLHTTPPYSTPSYGTADATPSYGDATTGSAPSPSAPSPSYEATYEAASYEAAYEATPGASYGATRESAYAPTYESPYKAAPAADPFDTATYNTPTTGTGAEPPAGPFSAPPAGEPWHAPAGDRP